MKVTAVRRNAMVDNFCAQHNSGTVNIYAANVGVPADADAANTNTLLCTLTFGSTAFGAASGGVATANSISQDTDADATGTAAFARTAASGGTVLGQWSVGTSGAEINLNTLSIVQHATVSITSMTITMGVGT
ncbi:MAG: hypothetical protein WC551_07750 [Patescibacteria group bacterium]